MKLFTLTNKSLLPRGWLWAVVVVVMGLSLALNQGVRAQDQSWNIEVRVQGFDVAKGGSILVRLDTAETFEQPHESLPDNWRLAMKTPASEESVVFVFKAIPSGEYSIRSFHDANSNSQLDVNFIGIPTEGVGASVPDEAEAFTFGPPSFKNLKFLLNETTVNHMIKIQYLL